MQNKYARLVRNQANVKVMVQDNTQVHKVWLLSLAAVLAAGAFYFFNIFFAFPGGRALIGD